MFRTICRAASMLGAVALIAAVAVAQGPGGARPPMSPAVMAKMQAWRTWRDKHPNVGQLERSVRGLLQVEQNPATKLNHVQAHTLLTVINHWRYKSALTDAQAATVNKQIAAVLSSKQRSALTTAMTFRGRFGGPGGPGMPGGPGGRPRGGPGGPGGPGGRGGRGGPGGPGGPGGRGGFDMSKMPSPHDYNPLNPSTEPMDRMRERVQQTLNSLIALLKAS